MENNSINEITESDDDCEVYFLKPVNEYNIMEKIKAANKELFSQDEGLQLDVESLADSVILQNNRKVSFARNLEEYEPQITTTTTATMAITTGMTMAPAKPPTMTTASVHFDDDHGDGDDDNVDGIETLNGKFDQKFEQKLEKVEEEQEEEVEIETEAEAEDLLRLPLENLEIPQVAQEECLENVNIDEEKVIENEMSNLVHIAEEENVCEEYLVKREDGEILEEICEEICVMNIEDENGSNCSTHSYVNQRRIITKQITFDYGCFEETSEHYQAEDNESLTNLLTLDNVEDEIQETDINQNVEEKESSDKENTFSHLTSFKTEVNEEQTLLLNGDEQLCGNEKEEQEQGNGEDSNEINSETDDDQLSIIVAAYIHDDYENTDKISLTSDKCLLSQENDNDNNNNNQNARSNKHENQAKSQPRHKKTFGKCFSFRRKIKKEGLKQAKNEVGTTDLKLHYKTCCEYKNFQKKLPKYTGYLSEYGLSEEQLMERERKLQKRKFSLLQQTLRASEEELRKMQDNERAFVRWLKNKIRFPVNKTRNMFDVKRPFGGRKLKRNDINVEKTDPKSNVQENLNNPKQQQPQRKQRKSCKVIKKSRKNDKK